MKELEPQLNELDLQECLEATTEDGFYLKMLLDRAVAELKVYREYFYKYRALSYDGTAAWTGHFDFQKGIWDVMEFRNELDKLKKSEERFRKSKEIHNRQGNPCAGCGRKKDA